MLIRIRNQKDFVKRKIELSQIPEIDNSHPKFLPNGY